MNFYRIRRNRTQLLEPHNHSLSMERWFQEDSNFTSKAKVEKMMPKSREENFTLKQPQAPSSRAQSWRKPTIEESFVIEP